VGLVDGCLPIFNYLISTGGALLGLFAFILGVAGAPLCLYGVFRRTSLIFGQNCLQQVVGKTRVYSQIPFKNIAKIELVRKGENAGLETDFIGIDLLDVNDPATLCPAFESVKRTFGWHCKLTHTSAVPLEKIYDRLQKRLA